MDASNVLGSVEVEVRANLENLTRGFSRAKTQTAAFERDVQSVAASTKKAFDEQVKLEGQLRQLVRAYDPLHAATIRYGDDLVRIQRLEKAGIADALTATRLRAGALNELQNATARARQGIAGSERAVSGFGFTAGHARMLVGGLAAMVGVNSVQAFAGLVQKTLESTAAIKDFAAQVGLTTREVQEYRLIAKEFGLSQDEIDAAFREFNQTVRQAGAGLERPKKLFDLLGVSLNDASGNLRPMNDLFLETIDRLGRVGNDAQRAAGQALAFGETAGPKMAQLIGAGSERINELRQAIADTGMVLSDEQIQKADETAKKLDQVKQVLQVKFAQTVVDNADAIGKLADAMLAVGSAAIGAAARLPGFFGLLMDQLDGLAGKIAERMPMIGGMIQMLRALRGLSADAPLGPSATVKLPPPKPVAGSGGGNIDLESLLAPKPPKGRTGRGGRAVENQFEREALREQEAQLRLERQLTGNLVRQNEIDHELIDINLKQRVEQLDQMVSRKSLTAAQAKKLRLEAEENAALEREVTDRKFRVEVINQSYRAAQEMLDLEQDALSIEHRLARTHEERKSLELLILSTKQQQAVSEIEKQIALAREAEDADRIADLTEQRRKLLENQKAEIEAFEVESLRGFEKLRNDLPRTAAEINEAIESIRFDRFAQKLEQAARFAEDIGSAFGRAAGALARFEDPLDVLQGLIADLAQTFTENFIEKPVTEWATRQIGMPLAKQGFGDELMAQAGLSAQQMSIALAQATGTLTGLNAALPPTTVNISTLATAAGAAAAALTALATSQTASSIAGIAGAASGAPMFGPSNPGVGFSSGGFTGYGNDNEVAGVVHRNEWVWDAGTTRRNRPLLQMISAGRLPSIGMGLAGMLGQREGDRYFNLGGVHVSGAKDDRSARRGGRQAAAEIQRRLSLTVRAGVNKS